MREIVLDTETTGLDPKMGHRIIEIGAIELINHIPTDQYFHTYVNPEEKEIAPGAFKVHGISSNFLLDKPLFKDVAEDFLKFINKSPVLAHNASFDVGFLNHELSLQNKEIINEKIVVDTLKIARKKHPGMPNNLDALCKRYNVTEQKRGLHDAKSDCELLAQVYIELIGGRQRNFQLSEENTSIEKTESITKTINREKRLSINLTFEEIEEHNKYIRTFGSDSIWNINKKN
mgnify:CR=1 FL=1